MAVWPRLPLVLMHHNATVSARLLEDGAHEEGMVTVACRWTFSSLWRTCRKSESNTVEEMPIGGLEKMT